MATYFFRLCFGIVVAGVIASPANADWLFKKEENAFDEAKSTYIALTATGSSYAFGIRCMQGELSIIFLTPESLDKDTAKTMNLLSPKMLLRVDKNPAIEADASLDEVDGKLVVLLTDAEMAKQVSGQIVSAKQRIAVALKAIDKTFHNQNFSGKDAGRNVRRVIDGCSTGKQN